MDLKDHIRTIPDFPKPGIMFRDVTTLISHGAALQSAVARLAEVAAPLKPTSVAGVEARGFVLAGAIACQLGVGATLVRKKGKLPWKTISEDYELEYGQATVEVHEDALTSEDRVFLVDDLIATGGTGLAALSLCRRLGATPVLFGAVIDLPELGGADKIRATGCQVEALVAYAGH